MRFIKAEGINLTALTETRRIFFYPVILIVTWLPAFINRLLTTMGYNFYYLTLLHIIGSHSQGFINGFYYAVSQRRKISEYFNRNRRDSRSVSQSSQSYPGLNESFDDESVLTKALNDDYDSY